MMMKETNRASALAAVDRAAAKYIPTARDDEFRNFIDRLLARDEEPALFTDPVSRRLRGGRGGMIGPHGGDELHDGFRQRARRAL